MTTYTRPLVNGTPTTGQVVKAGHVNEPIDQIYDTILAGGITADQIAVGAVDTSELATAAVIAAKMDGTLPDASAMATSAAPTINKQLANKKYVDDQISAIQDPTYPGGTGTETHTFDGGLIIKTGIEVSVGAKTFGTAFPTDAISVNLTPTGDVRIRVSSVSKTGYTSAANAGTAYHWIAIGY